MTKIYLNLIFVFVIAFFCTNVVICQSEEKSRLNPPNWIFGEWSNSADSNLNNWEAFIFSSGKINFLQGFGKDSKTVDFAEKFKDFEIEETIEPELYRVTFTKGTSQFIYEVKICKDCISLRSTSLTYSVTENQKVVREHLKSVNLVLFREESGG